MTLQEQLRDLTEPCREVDAEIAKVFGWDIRQDLTAFPKWPGYTASLDAAVELVERELPEWNIQIWKFNAGPEKGGQVVLYQLPIFHGYASDAHTLPAVALLLALIEAKEAD